MLPTTNFDRIGEFHAALDHIRPAVPTLPDDEMLRLRHTLIQEEYQEVTAVIEAILNSPTPTPSQLIPLVHELTDLLYVTYGALFACGVNADELFAEIHTANMRKMSGPRRADGKLLKPADWQPADVTAVLTKQGWPANNPPE